MKGVVVSGLLVAGFLIGGSVAAEDRADLTRLEKALAEREQAIEQRERELERRLKALEGRRGDAPHVSAPPPAGAGALAGAELLPNARAGECFAKVRVPAQYDTVTEDVVVREASHQIEVVPARYEWVEEKVLIKPASEKIVEVPAVYETKKEQVVVEPARRVWRTGRGSKAALAKPSVIAAAQAAGLAKEVKVGECFAEFHQAARYETRPEQLVKREAAHRIEVVPARYEWVEERMIVKEASEKIVEVPAVYETVTEKVLKTPAHVTWKKGRGPIERVDHSTGEILCRVEVPATYETVTKRVLKTPATTKKVTVPAEYKTVRVQKLVAPAQEKKIEIPAETITLERREKVADESIVWRPAGSDGPGKATGAVLCGAEIPARTETVVRSVLKQPATTNKLTIPAEYSMMRVRKLVSPAQEKRVEIAPVTKKITRTVPVTPEKLGWQPVLCETNTTPQLISSLQQALQKQGFDPGPIDGVLGRQTLTALELFQRKKGLATGGVTTGALAALGVEFRR